MTLSDLRTYVRDLTGIYSTDILPDALLNRWLQEAWTEVNRAEDWPWLAAEASNTLNTPNTTITLTNYSGRMKEVVAVFPSGLIVQVPSSQGLINTVDGDNDPKYYNTASNVGITFTAAFDENVTIKTNYYVNTSALATSGDASPINEELEPLLAYRAAAKTLRANSDDSTRADYYQSEFDKMLELTKLDYAIDNDLGPIQIGGEISRVDGTTAGRVSTRYRGI
jgi:hypothetical protein